VFTRILFASLAARRLRLLLALLAVSLGVAVATALATLSLQVGDDLARTLRAAGPNFVVQPAGAVMPLDLGGAEFQPARAGATLPVASVALLKKSFWKNALLAAAPELSTVATIDGQQRFPLLATWFEHSVRTDDGEWVTGLRALRPTWTVSGRWPKDGEWGLAVGRDLAARLHVTPGQQVWVDVAGIPTRPFVITGIVTAGGREDGCAWTNLSALGYVPLDSVVAAPTMISRIWVSALVRPGPSRPAPDPVRDPGGYERFMCSPYPSNVANDLAQHIPGAEVLPLAEVVAGESQVVGRLNLLLLLLALAALAAATLGLISTTTATVVERSVEIGLLRSLGATSRQLAALLLGETTLIALIGGGLGWLLGGIAATLVRGEVFQSGGTLEPLLLPLSLALAVGVAFLGTLGPLRMALRLDPSTVLRG
jgi:putative ABC transport system permease protein